MVKNFATETMFIAHAYKSAHTFDIPLNVRINNIRY